MSTSPNLTNNPRKKLTPLTKSDNNSSIVDYISYHPDLYARMSNYIKKKRAVRSTQDLARLAVSFFLDKEGF